MFGLQLLKLSRQRNVYTMCRHVAFFSTGSKIHIDLDKVPKEDRLLLDLTMKKEREDKILAAKFLKCIDEMRGKVSFLGGVCAQKKATYRDLEHPAFTLNVVRGNKCIGLAWSTYDMYGIAYTRDMPFDPKDKEPEVIKGPVWHSVDGLEDLELSQGVDKGHPIKVPKDRLHVMYSKLDFELSMEKLLKALERLGSGRDVGNSYHLICMYFAECLRFNGVYAAFSQLQSFAVVVLDGMWKLYFRQWRVDSEKWVKENNLIDLTPAEKIKSDNKKKDLDRLCVLLMEGESERETRRERIRQAYGTAALYNKREEFKDVRKPPRMPYIDPTTNKEKWLTSVELEDVRKKFWQEVLPTFHRKGNNKFPTFFH